MCSEVKLGSEGRIIHLLLLFSRHCSAQNIVDLLPERSPSLWNSINTPLDEKKKDHAVEEQVEIKYKQVQLDRAAWEIALYFLNHEMNSKERIDKHGRHKDLNCNVCMEFANIVINYECEFNCE